MRQQKLYLVMQKPSGAWKAITVESIQEGHCAEPIERWVAVFASNQQEAVANAKDRMSHQVIG